MSSYGSRLQRRVDGFLRMSNSREGSRGTSSDEESTQDDGVRSQRQRPITFPNSMITDINPRPNYEAWTKESHVRSLNPPIDFHLLDYVAECDENLVCPICKCPFVEPIAFNECDHTFCRGCLLRFWGASQYVPGILRGNCPTCRTACKLIARGATSRILVNILDELIVKCPRHTEGCTAEVKRGEVQDHINGYCGYAWTVCPEEDCGFYQRRKDGEDCLHFGVTCIDCRKSMHMANLEDHWVTDCPDRRVVCTQCSEPVFYREIDTHAKNTCPAITIPCTGVAYGCTFRSKRGAINQHTKACMFATIAPMFEAQKKRMDEQEAQQALLTRKVQILEGGFQTLQDMLDASHPPENARNLSSGPELDSEGRSVRHTFYIEGPTDSILSEPAGSDPPTTAPATSSFDTASIEQQLPIMGNESETNSPYQYLLYLHENLRDEVARVSSALHELDGRHGMAIVNETMRIKEDMAHLGGQVGGLSRQLGWLASTRLQQGYGGSSRMSIGGASSVAAGSGSVENEQAGPSEGGGPSSRFGLLGRRVTDEGRTKL
ncbi:hypothetical protein MBLNU457_5375t1 [Dothideomycetes sp. NU457]